MSRLRTAFPAHGAPELAAGDLALARGDEAAAITAYLLAAQRGAQATLRLRIARGLP